MPTLSNQEVAEEYERRFGKPDVSFNPESLKGRDWNAAEIAMIREGRRNDAKACWTARKYGPALEEVRDWDAVERGLISQGYYTEAKKRWYGRKYL